MFLWLSKVVWGSCSLCAGFLALGDVYGVG